MSIDVALVIDTGRTYTDADGTLHPDPATIWESDITYNLSPIMKAAGLHISGLNGQTAPAALEAVTKALGPLIGRPDHFKTYNPGPEFFGDYEDCIEFLQRFAHACRLHPNTTVHIS